MHKARSKSSLLSSAAPAGGAWTSSRMFRICLAGVLGALVIWQLARHSSDFPGADQRKHREDALHGQRQERGSSGSSSAQRRSAAAKAHCDLDACIELDLATQHRASSSMYGVALEDINHAIEGGLHVEMLRDWSFEARAYLAAHPELVLDTAKDVPAKPWPSHAPAMARGQSTLQQASMDPSGVASAPLLDEQAWHVSGNGIQEVMETVKRTALSELHALCIQSNSVTQTWLTNKGHTLLGFGVEGGSAYLLRARVKGASAGMSIQAALGTSDGATMFAEAKLRAEELSGSATVTRDVVSSGDPQSDDWVVLEATLRPEEARGHVSLHLTWHGPGRLCLDWVSLVPKSAMSNSGELDPFHPRLVQALTQLQPQFLRFPGGAFVEGVTLDSAYRWKLAVGPRELRPGHPNANWGYWSSDGVGLFEFMQLSEQLGAQPVWVLPVGISQTESTSPEELDSWIKDALDSIEFMLGTSTSTWGTMRAAMGRVQPWALRYVTLGNEQCRRPWYAQHFARLSAAILGTYPSLQILSNCDLGTEAGSSTNAWEFHLYKDPAELFKSRSLIEEYEGQLPVAVTEYAALGESQLQNAVAEAGFISAFENQCGKVQMMAYAPFMGHAEMSTWTTTLITFNDTRHWTETPSYVVQQVYSRHWRGSCMQVNLWGRMAESNIQASATCTSMGSGGVCAHLSIKIVNFSSQPSRVQLVLSPGKRTSLLHRRDSGILGREAVEAKILTLDEVSLRPRGQLQGTAASGSTATGGGDQEEEQDILGLLSSAAQSGDNRDPLKALEETGTTPLQLSVAGKAAVLDLPAFSLSVITAKIT